jgi:hypothetical protein
MANNAHYLASAQRLQYFCSRSLLKDHVEQQAIRMGRVESSHTTKAMSCPMVLVVRPTSIVCRGQRPSMACAETLQRAPLVVADWTGNKDGETRINVSTAACSCAKCWVGCEHGDAFTTTLSPHLEETSRPCSQQPSHSATTLPTAVHARVNSREATARTVRSCILRRAGGGGCANTFQHLQGAASLDFILVQRL